MNRNFYRVSIFLTALYLAINVFQAIVQSQQGARLFYLKAVLPWLFLVAVVNFAALFMVAEYYRQKKYNAAFSMVVAMSIAYLFYYVVIYRMLTGTEVSAYYYTTYAVMVLVGMVHAVVLIFSNVRERALLKAAGVLGFVLGAIQLSVFLGVMISQSFRLRETLGDAQEWVALVTSSLLVLYIMNFWDELKMIDNKKEDLTPQRTSPVMMIFAGVLFAATGVLGFNLATDQRMNKLGQNKPASAEAGRLAQRFEARIYVDAQGDTLPYRLMKPLNYNPFKKYPLMVCLHHGGAHGTDNIIQVEGGAYAQVLSDEAYKVKYPAFIFVPQCPAGSSWGGIPQVQDITPLAIETMAALEKEFSIDEKRRYVAGLSGGGFGSWYFITMHPEMFAAAIPICGGGDPSLARDIVDVPVWAFHGTEDQNVPVGFSRDMIQAIKDAGGDPKYTEFPGEGHNIWDSVIKTPGVLDWLFEQKRK